MPDSRDCAVTFYNEGTSEIIIEPRNEYGGQDDAVLVSPFHSETTSLYAQSYIISLYSKGYEKSFFPHFQYSGIEATSASISIGFDPRTQAFSWVENSILRGDKPLVSTKEAAELAARIKALESSAQGGSDSEQANSYDDEPGVPDQHEQHGPYDDDEEGGPYDDEPSDPDQREQRGPYDDDDEGSPYDDEPSVPDQHEQRGPYDDDEEGSPYDDEPSVPDQHEQHGPYDDEEGGPYDDEPGPYDFGGVSEALQESEEPGYESDKDPSYDPQFDLLDIVFIVDATGNRGNFLVTASTAIKASFRDLHGAFRSRNFRVGLVVTRDFVVDGSTPIVEITPFTHDVAEFERDLDAIDPQGGEDGFGAFNAGMKEALGPDMKWRDGAKKVCVLLTASIPRSIGEREKEDQIETYTIEVTDPILMARRMSLLGIKLCVMADANQIVSGHSRVLCFYRALATMTRGSTHSVDEPIAIEYYVRTATLARIDPGEELHPPATVERSSKYKTMMEIFSQANKVTDSLVRAKLGLHDRYLLPVNARAAFTGVNFVNRGFIKISLDVTDNRNVHTKKDLFHMTNKVVTLQSFSKFSYVLRTRKQVKKYTDQVIRTPLTIQVHLKIS